MKIELFAALALAAAGVSAAPAAIPLPEHPRPDWERPEWMNLNGEWDFGFAPGKYDRKISVPFGWGAPLSGVKDEGDTGYYRRSVTVPAAWKGKRVFIVVGAADHDTNCIFDGEDLGMHSGGYTPFEYELTPFVKWGEAQTLEFKVRDPSPKEAQSGHWLYGKQGYGNARGIWQTVYLEARGDVYLERVAFVPAIKDGSVTVHAVLSVPANEKTSLKIELDGKVETLPVEPGQMVISKPVKLAKPRFWTLEDPYLYDVKLTFGADVVKSYFGFRFIGVGKTANGDPCMTLNERPVYLQLTLDQSYNPEGWYTFPSDEFMKNEILISKRLALSGNRVHIKAEVPRKLYWADKLGLLIQADVPCAWGDVSEAMFEEHWKCFEGMVKRDFNHPSVYQWTLFNETWGLFSNRSLKMGLASGGKKERQYRPWAQRKVAEAYLKAKFIDPTRLVEDNSPCNHDHVATDVNSWHAYCPGYGWEAAVDDWCRNTYAGSKRNFVTGQFQHGEPMMNSECGNVWGYAGSTGDCDFSWDYHLMINAFRRHLKCTGWLYTEHHDVCNEWNGYVRYDRSRKFDGMDELAGMEIKDFHRDAAVFMAGTPGRETGEMCAPGAKVEIPLGVSLITEKYAGKKLTLSYDGWRFNAEGVRTPCAKGSLPGEFVAKIWQCERLWNYTFVAPAEASCGCVVFTLRADGEEIARNFWSYGVTNAAAAAVVRPSKSQWSEGEAAVLGGLKVNGFGNGFFEFELEAPSEGGTFRAEVSAKRRNGKDRTDGDRVSGLDYMLGGGFYDRSKNSNSYPQTSETKYQSKLKVYVGGELVAEMTLVDDPADHRGILSWLSQPHDRKLRETGSYGWLVEAPVAASAVKNGKVTVRLEADRGAAVYGPAFGRYPLAPHVGR
ncbi:MAG: glycoside hydrolase family 2 [Kiritimatiellae bacterium]|nr:glycoside hydrolase family 2 [Kiritimatiellia bacterium]